MQNREDGSMTAVDQTAGVVDWHDSLGALIEPIDLLCQASFFVLCFSSQYLLSRPPLRHAL